jgi:hypothetical protein
MSHIRHPQGAVRHAALQTAPLTRGQHRSQAHGGVHPLNHFTHQTQRFQPLPRPRGTPPYQYDIAGAYNDPAFGNLGGLCAKFNKLVFHVGGDTGGVKTPEPQIAVAKAMTDDLRGPEQNRPQFFYHLGDVVYFNGEHDQYYEQFYEPYGSYAGPIFSIPGNHDGDPADEYQESLDGWAKFFMTDAPKVDAESRDEPRLTMMQPNVYWTLITPLATIVGLYTNVPEHGSIDSVQQQWLTNEFATADQKKALLVAMHHPVYSFDDHHSGSSRMADVLQNAINDSRRVPNMVLAGHVHNYQRIEREIVKDLKTPFLVVGNSGYHHLHDLPETEEVMDQQTGAELVYGDSKLHGYVTLTIDSNTIKGTQTAVNYHDGSVKKDADTFEYTAKALSLSDDVTVSL